MIILCIIICSIADFFTLKLQLFILFVIGRCDLKFFSRRLESLFICSFKRKSLY